MMIARGLSMMVAFGVLALACLTALNTVAANPVFF